VLRSELRSISFKIYGLRPGIIYLLKHSWFSRLIVTVGTFLDDMRMIMVRDLTLYQAAFQ
jgi:hypothetical protein